MVEQLVRSQLASYLEEHAFISTDQSAYLKGHSTQISLHRVIDDWLENINDIWNNILSVNINPNVSEFIFSRSLKAAICNNLL